MTYLEKSILAQFDLFSTINIHRSFIQYFKNINKAAYLSIFLTQYSMSNRYDQLDEFGNIIFENERAAQMLCLSPSMISKIRKQLQDEDILHITRIKDTPPIQLLKPNFKKIKKIIGDNK